ncbi:hypothetical protein [Deinococcus ruber]|nr:hypothetical protein [Deinococcus ruber]
MGVSVGMAHSHEGTESALLELADACMYANKQRKHLLRRETGVLQLSR